MRRAGFHRRAACGWNSNRPSPAPVLGLLRYRLRSPCIIQRRPAKRRSPSARRTEFGNMATLDSEAIRSFTAAAIGSSTSTATPSRAWNTITLTYPAGASEPIVFDLVSSVSTGPAGPAGPRTGWAAGIRRRHIDGDGSSADRHAQCHSAPVPCSRRRRADPVDQRDILLHCGSASRLHVQRQHADLDEHVVLDSGGGGGHRCLFSCLSDGWRRLD